VASDRRSDEGLFIETVTVKPRERRGKTSDPFRVDITWL
jgi:hypothetical protein